MEYLEAKEKFINSWGELGCTWGICKTMGHIHGLLLINKTPMCCESIMTELEISRGNANMNLRALIDWGLVHKGQKEGSRKEFFQAEKDIWKVFKLIIEKRKEKELLPMIQMIQSLQSVNTCCPNSVEFKKVISELEIFSTKADKALNRLINSESNLLLNSIVKLIR